MGLSYTATLKYNANGGTGAPSSQTLSFTSPQYCTHVISQVKPTRSGYIFMGWAKNQYATTPEYLNPPTTNTSSSYGMYTGGGAGALNNTETIYAIWQATSLPYSATLIYNASGGSNGPVSQTQYSASQNTLKIFPISGTIPQKTGNTFLGWGESQGGSLNYVYHPGSPSYFEPENCSIRTGDSSNPNNQKTLYAIWQAHTYTITYNKGANGSGTNQTQTKYHGTPVTLKGAIFTRSGYSQDGWSTSDGGSKVYNLGATYSTNANITLYPHWTVTTYTITYNKGANGSGTNQTQPKYYGVDATLKGAIFTRSGYSQDGWSTSDGGSKVYNLGATYSTNANITLYPHWIASTYNVVYHRNFSSDNTVTEVVLYGGSWTTLSSSFFPRPGYKIVGWSRNPDGPVLYLPDSIQSPWYFTSDLDLYAIWEIESLTHVKTASGIKDGIVYVKTSNGMKLGTIYVKRNDGQMHQGL